MSPTPLEPVLAAPARPRLRAVVEGITVTLFAGVLLAPFADQCVRPDEARSPRRENRKAREAPATPHTLAGLSAWPAAYEAHYADTFGLRDVLLHWNSLEKITVFDLSPAPTVVKGPGDWLAYSGEETLEVFRGLAPMTMDDLAAWTSYLWRCRDFCERRGARYYYVVCPNKETIYPDFVRAEYEPLGPTRLDQLMAFLPDDLRECVVDTRAALITARENDHAPDDYLYNVSGTHWNGRGAWVAYQALMRRMLEGDADTQPLAREDVYFSPDPVPSPDTWAPHLYVPELFAQPSRPWRLRRPQHHEVVEATQGQTPRWHARNLSVVGPNVLVFHDSFGPLLAQPLAETFPQVTLVQYWFDPALIMIEQPGAVIEVRVERMLVYRPFLADVSGIVDEVIGLSPEVGRIVVAIDPASPAEALTVVGPARIERRPDALVFSAESGRGGWLLPEFTVAEGERAWLHVELESDARGMLAVYRRSETSGEWLRRDAAFLPFGAGRESRTIALPGPVGPRAIRVHLFNAPTSVRIGVVEVRTTNP